MRLLSTFLFKLCTFFCCIFINKCIKINNLKSPKADLAYSSSSETIASNDSQINTGRIYSKLLNNHNRSYNQNFNGTFLGDLSINNKSPYLLESFSQKTIHPHKHENKSSELYSSRIYKCLAEDDSHNNGMESLHDNKGAIYYHMNSTSFKIVTVPARTCSRVVITSVTKKYSDFLVFEAHSQIRGIILSYTKNSSRECMVNNSNPAIILHVDKTNASWYDDYTVYLSNFHHQSLSVLLIVRNYTNKEPIPGGLFAVNSTFNFPHPYLIVQQNILTTTISFPLASLNNIITSTDISSVSPVKPIPYTPSIPVVYRIYLSYLYEGDLFEDHYRDIIIRTSTVEGLKRNSTMVLEIDQRRFQNNTVSELFISYSGVGAVVTVVASFNGSEGALYSSSVFYGCDFIDEAKYNCTKLVSSFAKLFCASLLFIGAILLIGGHRWLNFTMFISGFLTAWFILFITFVQLPNRNIDALGILTMFGAFFGGVLWLFLWHKFHRPFYSALLIILLCGFLTAMISTHFLKYAIVPTPNNIVLFVMFPVAFCVAVIGYSVFDMKKVHIMSCCLIGSYSVVMPFAFYFGSSLTYIVINVISLMCVEQYSKAIGFPPFQYCDIILLCIWILLFIGGVVFQGYRERLGPPFYPPNASSLKAILSVLRQCLEKVREVCGCCSCCRNRSDNDSLFDDRPPPSSSSFSRIWASVFPCCGSEGERPRQEFFSAYESFPRIGSDDDGNSIAGAIVVSLRKALAYVQRGWVLLRQKIARTGGRQSSEDDEPLGNEITRESDAEDIGTNRIG